jgi:D,D-heptose 1,7-bisphosphate phosphatase
MHAAPVDLRQADPVTIAGPGEAEPDASPDGGNRPLSGTSRSCSRPGILLDRDGTIIADHGYVGSIDRVDFIEGSPEAIARFNQANIPVAVVTNQAGVARGLYGIEDVDRVHRYITECLVEYGAHIDLFVYCPYHPDGVVEAFTRTSHDRKPMPGMAKAAEAALDLDLTASWVVGDRPEDMSCLAIETNWDYRPRPQRHCGFDSIRIDQVRPVVGAIDQHRLGAGPGDGFDGRDEGVRRKDALVAAAHTERTQRNFDRVGPIRHPNAMARPDICRVIGLKLAHLRSGDE